MSKKCTQDARAVEADSRGRSCAGGLHGGGGAVMAVPRPAAAGAVL